VADDHIYDGAFGTIFDAGPRVLIRCQAGHLGEVHEGLWLSRGMACHRVQRVVERGKTVYRPCPLLSDAVTDPAVLAVYRMGGIVAVRAMK
jgi:hypothetical protein